jgi:glyoxylase-like metal-dependent hydrolase (beta-lactamase superfamily II)
MTGGATPEVTIRVFNPGPWATNCYVVRVAGSGACWVVDCGFDAKAMLAWIAAEGISPEALVLTHTHVDHILGVQEFRRAFAGAPVFVHGAEAGWLEDPQRNLTAFMGQPISIPEADSFLVDGQELTLGGAGSVTRWRVLHTPGHSPGGIGLYHEGPVRFVEAGRADVMAERVVLAGDTLFRASIGRSDLPGGDMGTLAASIRTKLYTLAPETLVLPGHGPHTTIGQERGSNPYVKAAGNGQ